MAKPKARSKIEDFERKLERAIGAKIKTRRVLQSMSQAEFANVMGLSYQQQHRYEVGEQSLTAARLYRVAEALGVNVSVFFENLDAEHIDIPIDDRRTRLRLELFRVFNLIGSEDLQEQVVKFLRVMIDNKNPPGKK